MAYLGSGKKTRTRTGLVGMWQSLTSLRVARTIPGSRSIAVQSKALTCPMSTSNNGHVKPAEPVEIPPDSGGAMCPAIRRGPVTVDYLRIHPTVSVEQAALLVGISRAYCYGLVHAGELDAITLGERRIRVKSASLLRLLGQE